MKSHKKWYQKVSEHTQCQCQINEILKKMKSHKKWNQKVSEHTQCQCQIMSDS